MGRKRSRRSPSSSSSSSSDSESTSSSDYETRCKIARKLKKSKLSQEEHHKTKKALARALDKLEKRLKEQQRRRRRPSSSSESSSSSSEEERKHKRRSKKLKHNRGKKRETSSSLSPEVDLHEVKKDLDKLEQKLKKAERIHKFQHNLKKPTYVDDNLLNKSKARAPMTREQWEKKQKEVRRVYDAASGRHRLIKGNGEVLEEIVSRNRHRSINQQATRGDGNYFQAQLAKRLQK